jgi:O-antigen ligase
MASSHRAVLRSESRWPLWAFCLWLVLLPLPFGAARTWALALVLPPLFLLAAAVSWRGRPDSGLAAFLLRPPGLLLAAFMLVVAAQLVPWTGAPLSVVPYRTQLYLLTAFGCTVTVWLTTVLIRSDRDLRLMLLALLAGGLLQAVIATLIMATRTGFSFLDSEIVADSVASGTFANRNHLAGYLNIALSAGIGLMVGHLAAPREGRRWALRVRDWMELMLGGKARLRLVLVMLVIVLIATRSRMGNAAFFAALLVATLVYAVFERERRRGLLLFAASVVAIDLLLIGAWVGIDRVVDRIQNTPLAERVVGGAPATEGAAGTPAAGGSATGAAEPVRRDPRREQSVEDRIEPALDAASIVRDHPLLGTGGGTFYLTYMAYQPNWEGFYNHAHNDYLEIAADTGLLGLGLLVGLAAHALWTAVGLLRRRRNPVLRSAGFAAVMSITAMALHALVDFNLHIPANALTFCVMVALPFAASRLHGREPREARGAREDASPSSPTATGAIG